MSQSPERQSHLLATLVTALGITVGATPAMLHAQADSGTARPAGSPEAVQRKDGPTSGKAALQGKDAAKPLAKPAAVQGKVEAVQGKQTPGQVKAEALQTKVGAVQGKVEAVQEKQAPAGAATPPTR